MTATARTARRRGEIGVREVRRHPFTVDHERGGERPGRITWREDGFAQDVVVVIGNGHVSVVNGTTSMPTAVWDALTEYVRDIRTGHAARQESAGILTH